MSDAIVSKACSRCLETKPVTEFYPRKHRPTPYSSHCKSCCSTSHKIYYANNREECLARTKRTQTPRTKEQLTKKSARYKAENPEKARAHYLTQRAIHKGELVRLPCEVCGAEDDVHAHHCDYSKPLDIMWLCRKHHFEWHRNNPL